MCTTTLTRSFAVLLSRKHEVETALTALAKRAARKGIPGVLAWTWGKAYQDEARIPRIDGVIPPPTARLSVDGAEWIVPVARITLDLVGEQPRLGGWRFIATLQHLDGENIVRTVPSEELPTSYRQQRQLCDHCHTTRRRNDTYVLRHDDGRVLQVGSSCIRDFLGNDEAAIIAAKAEILALAASVIDGDGDEGFGGGHGDVEFLLGEYLPIVAWAVRAEGWTSRTAAREKDETTATADRAWTLMTNGAERFKARCEPSEEDIALSVAAEAWAVELTDEAVNAATSDYLHNLRAVCRTGFTSKRTAGIAASVVVAYQRHVARERAAAERAAQPVLDAYVGVVGAKVSFGLPAKLGKKGQPLKGAPVVLSVAPVTLDFVTGYSTDYGYTTVLKFKTADGALLVWKASATDIGRDDVGKQFTLAGTIKEHSEYKGAKQTLLSRCDVRGVGAEACVEVERKTA